VIFGFIHKKIKNIVMSFTSNNLIVGKNNNSKRTSKDVEDLLINEEELKLILSIIKDCTFKGNQIEVIYDLTLKLQKALLSLKKDQ
jgi:hypothetical protein